MAITENQTTTTYYLRSSVLGSVVEELSSTGAKQTGYVYSPSGSLLATQVPATDYVSVKQLSPTGFSQHEFFTSPSSGAGNFRREFDPAGATVPLFNHSPGHGGSPGEIPAGGGALDGRFGDMSDPGAGCTLDGVWVPCSMAYRALGSGAASVASVSGNARVGLGRKPIWMEGDTSVGSIDPNTGAVTIRATGGHFEWIPDTDQFLENSISMRRVLLPQDTGGGGGNSPQLNTGPKAEFKYGKFLSCLKQYFPDLKTYDDGRTRSLSFDRSSGGSFIGGKNGRTIISRTETNSFDSKSLGQMLQTIGVGDGSPNSGATFNYYPQRNYVASDVASNQGYTGIGVFGVFIHELANSVGEQYGLADTFGGYAKQNASHGIGDPDVGAAFETCVFGGLVGLQSGRVGSHRELR